MKTIKRRRKEHKTDYLKRIKLLKSNSPRIVLRKTNRYLISQYVESKNAQDKTIFGTNSKILIKYGWPKNLKGSLKTLPAAYLTGLLMGIKISEKKLKKPIMDLGMIRSLHKNRMFAFLKGMKDSGIEIKCDKDSLPDEGRIRGKHLKQDFSKTFEEIKSKIEKNE